MLERVHRLAQSDATARRHALLDILTEIGAPHHIERLTVGAHTPHNIHVPLHGETPYLLLAAHYDAVPVSTGANDNASGMAVLLSLLAAHLRQPFLPPCEILFFDLEEAEMQGSMAYVRHHDLSRISAMINLDLCGVGDAVLVCEGSRVRSERLSASIRQCGALPVAALPPGDDYWFEGRVPTASFLVVPHDDIDPIQAFAQAQYRDQRSRVRPSVLETMHNHPRDRVESVQAEALAAVYAVLDRLLRAL